MLGVSSLTLRCHLSVLYLRLPHLLPCPMSTMDHVKMHLAYAFLPFSISGNEGPFLRLPLTEKTSRKTCPVSLEAPKLSGFGYPLVGDFQLLISLATSFSRQRSWASLFRVFLQLSDRYGFSTLSFRSCAFLQNLSAS